MKLALCYWILMLFWLVFLGCGIWSTGWTNLKQSGGNIMIFILFLLLGWEVFGAPLHK